MVGFKNQINLEEFLTSGKKTVLFLHNKESVERIVPFKKFFQENKCVLIPTSVELLFALDELKISYKIPEDYYLKEDYSYYFRKLEPKITNFTKQIDKLLQEFYPEIKKSGLEPSFYNLYPFVRIYHPLADAYFKIKKIIEKEKPDQIGLLIQEDYNEKMIVALESWLLWGAKENIFKKVLEIYQTNLPIYSFSSEKDKNSDNNCAPDSIKNKFNRLILKNPLLFYFFRMLKKNKYIALSLIFSRLRGFSPLLLLNNGYDFDECNKELQNKGCYIWGQVSDSLENWRPKNNAFNMHTKDIIEKLEKDGNFREYFKEQDIDFYPILKDKIKAFLNIIVPASQNAYQKTLYLLKSKKIKGILFSINPTAISKSICFAAKKSGVFVIAWQHGDMNYESIHAITLNDFHNSDLFLAWGQGSYENNLKALDELQLKRKSIVIGSSSLDKLIFSPAQNPEEIFNKMKLQKPKRPIIVYATSMYYLSNTYSISYVPYSDNELYKTQKTIIEKLSVLEGTKIIKLHPNMFYALSAFDTYANSFKQQNVFSTRSQINAPSLFSLADIIIIDMPTTTLLQAVTFKKPIFCLKSHLNISKKAEVLLQKRAVLADDPESLMEQVQEFIVSNIYKADINNNEFLENFGTLLDGNSAKRAANVIDELIKK